MVTPLVKTTKIKKKPNGFTRYQSDTAKRVSVRLFYSRITTTLVVDFFREKEMWRRREVFLSVGRRNARLRRVKEGYRDVNA